MLPILHSLHLTLCPATNDDLDDLWTHWTDPQVRRYLFDDVSIPREQAADILAVALRLTDRGLGLWIVRAQVDASLLGCVMLAPTTIVAKFEPRLAGDVEVLIALAPAAWGRGYASEALRAAIVYAFGELKLPRLAAAADIPNVASHRLLTRLGFQELSECDGPRYPNRTYLLTEARFKEHLE